MQTGDVTGEWMDALTVDSRVMHLNECDVIKGRQHGFTNGCSFVIVIVNTTSYIAPLVASHF